jgi:hypothetical protein
MKSIFLVLAIKKLFFIQIIRTKKVFCYYILFKHKRRYTVETQVKANVLYFIITIDLYKQKS